MIQESVSPVHVSVPSDQTIPFYLRQRADQNPHHVVFFQRSSRGWLPLTARQAQERVDALAVHLFRLGVTPGTRVAVMSRTRLEWTIADLAIWTLGAVSVPVYETSSVAQTQWILSDSEATVAIAENQDMADIIQAAKQEAGGHAVTSILVIDNGDLTCPAPTDEERAALRTIPHDLDDLATIIYTSGTTGRPKGAVLTHGNFVLLIENGLEDLSEVISGESARTLLFLPMAHVFARFLSVLCVMTGVPLGHTGDVKAAIADVASFQPTFLMSVPRVWEKVYTGAEQKQGGGWRRRVFIWAVKTAIVYSRSLDTGGPSAALRAQHRLADRIVLSKIRAALGGHLKYAIAGGAPLGNRLTHFYRGLGLTMLEGYGLTETTAPLTVNRPDSIAPGTVGTPLPGTTIRIADDGEILARGIGVFQGYHNNEEATAEAFVDGWFKTGDVGSLDDAGRLSITGRKKEIIVTAGGKNVAPSQLEDALRVHPLISQCMVVGDNRPFCGVLITLDQQMLPIWLRNKGQEPLSVAEAINSPLVRQRIQMAIDRANRGVSRAESIRTFRILEDDFTLENGALTPSLKVKRHVVEERHADDIDQMYADAARDYAAHRHQKDPT